MSLPTAFNEEELMAEMDPGVQAAMGQSVGPFENSYDNQVLHREVQVQPDQPANEIGYDPPEYEIGLQDFAGEMVVPGTENIGVDGDDSGDDETDEEWPEYLLREAGLTAEQAAEHFVDRTALANVVRMQDQNYIEQGNRAAMHQLPAPVEAPEEVDYPEFELPPPSDGSEWGDDITRVFSQMNDNFKKALQTRDTKLKGIEEQYRQQRQLDEQRMRQQTIQQFDQYIDDLGPQFTGIFGRGASADLSQQSLAFRNRSRMLQTANALQAGLQADGRSPLPSEEAWTRAMMATFPAEVIGQIRETVTNESQAHTDGRQRLMTARPTARRQPTQPLTQADREHRAAATAEQFYRDRGFPPLAGDYDNSLAVI